MFDKNGQEIGQLLQSSLEAILSGDTSLEEVLSRHPELADLLQAELDTVMWLNARTEQVSSRPGFVASSRKRVLARIQQEVQAGAVKKPLASTVRPRLFGFQWVAALAIALVFITGAAGVAFSQNSLPGEPLYPVKQVSEQVDSALTFNKIDRVALSAQHSAHRLAEVETLLQRGDSSATVQALAFYKEQVQETVALLQGLQVSDATEKAAIANDVREKFIEQAGELSELKASAPASLLPQLEAAEVTMLFSAGLAQDELEEAVFTPTPVVLPSFTATATLQPTVMKTQGVPPGQLKKTQTATMRTPVGETLESKKPTNTPKLTNTPKPTNENRPADPGAKPTAKPDNPNKPDKPDKPDKPTGKDK